MPKLLKQSLMIWDFDECVEANDEIITLWNTYEWSICLWKWRAHMNDSLVNDTNN